MRTTETPGVRPVYWALAATLLFAALQTAIVTQDFGGNWTALFYTGRLLPIPPDLQNGTFSFPNSQGYDGQMYRYLAHDPWLNGIDHKYFDDAALRERRILVPGLAWIAALGRQEAIDFTYLFVIWLCVFAGCCWAGNWCESDGLEARWGLLYLIVPATVVALDRSTIDIATSTLTLGLLAHRGRGWVATFALAAALCLSRETGFIILLAVVIYAALHNRRMLMPLITGCFPAVGWYFFVARHQDAAARPLPGWIGTGSRFGIFVRLTHPLTYPLSRPIELLAQTFDTLALCGMLSAFGLAVYFWARNRRGMPQWIGLMMVASFPAVSATQFWDSAYGYSRPFSPLLISVALSGVKTRRWRWLGLLPILLILPRMLLQLGPDLAGILGIHLVQQ